MGSQIKVRSVTKGNEASGAPILSLRFATSEIITTSEAVIAYLSHIFKALS